MQRVKLSLACLFCLSVVGVAHAQTALESDSGVVVMEEYSGSATFAGTYFDIRTMTGDGVGYRNGYTQIGAMMPLWKDSDQFIAPNSRLIITDLGDVGANSGLVYRRYKPETDRVFGANAYFDYDQSVEGFTYHQLGFGLETLSANGWDARTNVYLPTTDNDNFVRPLALDCVNPILQGNQIGFLATGLFQQSVEGVDFEVGHQLTKSTPWLRGFAGAYFYDAPKDNPIGVRARIDAQISNDLSIGVNVTNDTNFGTNVNAVVDFRFSGWLPTRYFPNYTTQERMLSSVQRNWRIATANTSRDVFAPAKNPDTGNPFFIVWVDSSNDLPGPGTGTFENPFDDVPDSAPGADIVVVKVGDSTLLNPYQASIVLEDNQRLLGEGKAHQIQLISMFEGLMCPVVTTTLPGIATDGNFPFLTAPGNQNIVTLQDNNEVSAFNMVRAGGFAITNFPGVGSNDFNLNCLNLTNNTAGGISLTNASGTGMIKTVNAINNTGGGIFIDSAPAGLNLTIMDVVSSSVAAAPGFPQAFGLQLSANPGQITANITDSEFNRNTVGVILNGNGGDLTVNTNNASVDDNLTDGVQLATVNSDVNLFLQNSTFNRNGGFGFSGIMTGGSLDLIGRNVTFNQNDGDNLNLDLTNTAMAIDFRNATFNTSTTGSGIVISNSGANGTGTAVFNNITSTGNFLDGFQFNGDNLADIAASVRTSVLSDNGRDAFSVSGSNGAQVALDVRAVVATGSGRHGLNFNATGGSVLDIDFTASNLDFSGSDAGMAGRGVNGFADASTVSLTMTNTTAENSGADGMFVTAVNNAQVGISVQNGNFANSGQNTPGSDGVHIVTDTGADVVMQINNTPINNSVPVPGGTQDDGLVFEAANNSTILANVSNSDLSNNLSNAIEATVTTGAIVNLNLLNSNGLNSGEDGIRFDVQNGGQFNLTLQSSNFDFSGAGGTGNGMLGFVRSGGDVTVTALDSSFSNSAENGFELDIANIGSSFTMDMESGNFSDSGQAMLGIDRQDAFHITAGDQALVDISLFTTPSANTGGLAGTQQRGLWATVNTGADLSFSDDSGDLSGNLLNAINISVANAGSTATLNIIDTPANNSGEDGFIFNVVDSGVLQATFLRSTLDSSGLAGLPGDEFDAIDGTLDTQGVAILSFTDTAVTNAFHDGMKITASNDSFLNAVFDNSPLDGSGTNNSGDALRLTFDSGAFGIVTLQNGSTATDAGDDAVFISATNTGTTVILNATASNFSDSGTTATANGGNGIAAFVSDNASVGLNVTDTPIRNTVPTLPQLRGLLFDVQSGGLLIGTFTNSPMTGHDLEGINGSVDGAGAADSSASLTLVDTVVDNNGTFGALFNVTNDGDLALNASGTSSFSNNGATGILANVDGAGSTFDLVLDGTTVDSNGFGLGGDGIAITADNGAFISGDVTNASISNNANAGVVLTLLNGSMANFAQSFTDTTIDANGDQGLVATVESGSSLLLNVSGGSISNNGINGAFDNVNIFATDAGTMVETRFEGTVADNIVGQGRHGFNFTTLGGAMNLTQIRAGVSASGNSGGNGLRFVADGDGTQAVLFMSDTSFDGLTVADNQFSDNGDAVLTLNGGPDNDVPLLGGGVFFQATNGVDVAAIRFSGVADNNGNTLDPNRDIDADGDGDHDGVFIRVDNVDLFAMEIVNGSASGNVDQGIDVNISNVVTFGPVTKASAITPPDVTIGGGGNIVISDIDVDGNDDDGISLIIDGPLTIGDIIIDNVSSSNNGGDGLFVMLTDVTGAGGDLDLSITNSEFDFNGGRGVALVADNTPFDDILIDNNTIISSMGGDGLLLDMTDSGINTLTISNNQIGLSSLNGINIDLDNSPIGTLNITDNSIGLTQGAGGSFLDDSLPVLRAGFDTNTLAPNDDGSTGLTPIGFNIDFFGQVFSDLFVNNNGNVTFNNPLGTFTPFPIVTNGIPMLAPFFADVDTGAHGMPVTYGNGTIAGRQAFGVNWIDVDYFNSDPAHGAQLNSFQLVLIERGDIAAGDFDIEFNYGGITWETGDASGGTNGLGGSSARVGFTNGTTNSFEFAGSGVNGALLDSGPAGTSLIQNLLNSVNLGRYRFAARDGGIGGTSPNGGDGILINATNGSDIGTVNITGNIIQDNGGNGVEIVVDNSALGPVDISNNSITGNGVDGVRIVDLNLTNALLDINVAGNTIDDNGERGVNIVVPDAVDLIINLTDNASISNNGLEGVNLDLGVGTTLTAANVYGNTVNGNGGPGLRVTAPDANAVTLNLGDATQAANTFDGNTDAGFGMTMAGSSTGTLVVTNSTFANTVNGSDATFNGDGLVVTQSGSSVLTGSITNSSFTGNGFAAAGGNSTGSGIRFNVTGNTAGIFAELNDFTIGGATAADGNTITGNSANGIEIARTADGQVNNMTIASNTISDNNGNGIYILAANVDATDTYTINNNTITDNTGTNGGLGIPTGNGILFDERADADILANLDLNTITGNGNNGIQLIEQVNNAADSRSLSGTWTRNTITDNANNGISINGVTAGLVIGDAADLSLGNLIADNVNGSGILVTGAGSMTIGSNVIMGNGNLADLGTATEDAGIQMAVAPFSSITIVNNDIAFNNGDGVQWGIAQGFSGFSSEVFIQDNNISNNSGRGVDIINRGSNYSRVGITSNVINANLLEGVYIVNTASTTQDQFSSSITPLLANGNVFADPRLEVQFFDNEVIGNGLNSAASTTGLFVRVGTSDASNSFTDPGGFATGNVAGVGPVVAVGGNPFGLGLGGRGGVTMTVDQNEFGGNFGDDIRFASFISTVDPATSAGTWDAMTFTVNAGYQSDPLARLDLWFRQNTFDSHDVNNGAGVVTANQTNVAFYNNAEGTFKSRLNTATPAGPFTSATRRRNAQRQAARIPFLNAPLVSPDGGSYLYPGTGDSTFRASLDSDPIFFRDTVSPVINTFQEGGFFLPGSITGEQPFGWGNF